jgi:hypothetical protein
MQAILAIRPELYRRRFDRIIDKPPAQKPLEPHGKISTKFCASVVKTSLTFDTSVGAVSPSISLGAAMTISGAAQSPNQGNHTSPAVAALLTIFNIRLGWWLGNPRNDNTCRQESPKNGLRPILDELLAQATDEKGYVYLSDGGHFENLGLYELVRRRCKVIILCDADCDPHYRFDDLINAIELCRVDFGVQVELPTDPLLNSGKSNWSRSPFVIGTVDYGEVDLKGNKELGTILYLKSAVTRDNSVVVKKYDRDNATFPHESTANQWCDEMQFEAYRLLRLETAKRAFDALKKGSAAPSWWGGGDDGWASHVDHVDRFL